MLYSNAFQVKINEIQSQLEILGTDTSNLSNYLDKSLEIVQNLIKMWENLNYEGKVRLQKLVFPEGIVYESENSTVRTLAVNPIFAAINSISKISTSHTANDLAPKSEKLSQLYLGFGSSNFLWENLEEIANTLIDFMDRMSFAEKLVVSITAEKPCFQVTDSTFVFERKITDTCCALISSESTIIIRRQMLENILISHYKR